MASYKPTDEQVAIIMAAGSGRDLVIEAGAGAGKTSTLRMVADRRRGKGMYLAYNRALADEAKESFPKRVHCGTAHSYAWSRVGRRFDARLKQPRQPAERVALLLRINDFVQFGNDVDPLSPEAQARMALATVAKFCSTADPEITDRHVPWQRGLEKPLARKALVDLVLPYALKAWRDLNDEAGLLRFQHDYYLKMWQLTDPVIKRDYILFDEAQDADPVIAAIVNNQQCQRILVGDANQAIYGWRGAIDALSAFPGQRLTLTQSWRFGQRVADVANEWLGLLGSDLVLRGNPGLRSAVRSLDGPDAILCRTNAYAISQAIDALDRGVKVAVVGGGQEIERFARAAQRLQADLRTDHPDLMAFRTWDRVRDYVRTDDGKDLKVLVDLIERHGTDTILKVVKALADESTADLVISTAHKAKGREWRRVQIGADFREPEIDDTKPLNVQHEQAEVGRDEAMLAYVAATRAELVLDPKGLAWLDPSVHWCMPPPRRTVPPVVERVQPRRPELGEPTPVAAGTYTQTSLWDS
jgi:hypothetical protein